MTATTRHEDVPGPLRTPPRPPLSHSLTATTLLGELHQPFRVGVGAPIQWTFLREPELRLGPDVVVPDVAGWHRERLAALSTDASEIDIRPDWVCEVLLLSTQKLARMDKMAHL